jgi:hypothetical protein
MISEQDSLATAKIEQGQTANAFAQIFGLSGMRSEAQSRVIAHLEKCAGDDGNSFRFGDAKDGIALIAAGIHRDGAKSLLKVIYRQLELSQKVREPKPQPITKR